jgi:phospholipase/carboxylesterase
MALSGPHLEPKTGRATQLIVLCHGYGADGRDLIGLAPVFQRVMPTAAFVAPNGPERCPGAGYQWFPIANLDPQVMHKGVLSAAPGLENLIESELQRHALAPDRLALVGFSQGTMMALHVGMKIKPAAIVGFSGMLTGPPVQREAPPILLIHGEADPLIPAEALFVTAATLGACGVRVQWHLSHGLGHGIDDAGMALAGAFVSLAFAGRLQATGEASCLLR